MNGLPFTNAEGKADFLYEDELQAVEITGRSTWQDYRRYPTTWPQQHVQVISLMERRPGAVEPGKRPAEVGKVECRRSLTYSPPLHIKSI